MFENGAKYTTSNTTKSQKIMLSDSLGARHWKQLRSGLRAKKLGFVQKALFKKDKALHQLSNRTAFAKSKCFNKRVRKKVWITPAICKSSKCVDSIWGVQSFGKRWRRKTSVTLKKVEGRRAGENVLLDVRIDGWKLNQSLIIPLIHRGKVLTYRYFKEANVLS